MSSLRLFEPQIRMISKRRWELDIPVVYLQIGRVSDVERWYSRFMDQFIAYWHMHDAALEPAWTAVTGYYCAFYGAQTLLTMLGLGARGLPALGSLPAGLYRLSEAPSIYADHVLLVLDQQGTGSHRALWTQLLDVLNGLISLPGNDAKAILILQSLRQLTLGPPALAGVRNRINYSVDFEPSDFGAWRTELAACDSVAELEHRLQVTVPTHDAQRFELVALAAASLSRALYSDYLGRGKSLDLRPSLRRRATLSGADSRHPARLWF